MDIKKRRAMREIQRLATPFPSSTMEARLDLIAALASGRKSAEDTIPKTKPRAARGSREAKGGRDRKQTGGRTRAAAKE